MSGRNRRYLISMLGLVVILILLVAFRSLLAAYVLTPLVLFAQTVWKMVASVHQSVYWTILVVFCFLLTIRLIPPRENRSTRSAYRYNYKPPNKFEAWRTSMLDARSDANAKEYLRNSLDELVLSLSESQPRTPLPPAVRRYLDYQPANRNFISSLLPKMFRKKDEIFDDDNPPIDELLRWMEIELEINDEE